MTAGLLQHGKRVLERLNNVLKGHGLSLKHRLLAVLVDPHLDCERRCRFQGEQRLAPAIDRQGQKRRRPVYVRTFSLWLLSIVVLVTVPGNLKMLDKWQRHERRSDITQQQYT